MKYQFCLLYGFDVPILEKDKRPSQEVLNPSPMTPEQGAECAIMALSRLALY